MPVHFSLLDTDLSLLVTRRTTGMPLPPFRRRPLKSRVKFAYPVHFPERLKKSPHSLCYALDLLILYPFLVQVVAQFFAHVPCSTVASNAMLKSHSFICVLSTN